VHVSKPKGDLKNAIENFLTTSLMVRKVKNVEEAKKKLLMVYYKGDNTNNKKQLKKVYVDVSFQNLKIVLKSFRSWEKLYLAFQIGNCVMKWLKTGILFISTCLNMSTRNVMDGLNFCYHS
jgi:hypothetical protein